MNCKICGKPSGFFPLCKDCNDKKDKGLVVKCEKCGEWHYADQPCKCNDVSKCIICENNSNGKPLCITCFQESVNRTDEFDKNQTCFELKDYYFNLKSNIYRINNFEYVKNNCKKLFALAYLTRDIHKDSSLIDRVVDDVKDLIIKKTPKKENKVTKYTERSDSQKASIIRTLDGHIVKSNGESIIDDILYNNNICHCYEKEVYEITTDERTVKADWFIPIRGNKGIYLEYWGMDSDDYLKNKEEKKKLYKDFEISLIQIEKDDIKEVSGLTNRILREYETLKKSILKKFN